MTRFARKLLCALHRREQPSTSPYHVRTTLAAPCSVLSTCLPLLAATNHGEGQARRPRGGTRVLVVHRSSCSSDRRGKKGACIAQTVLRQVAEETVIDPEV